jgi:Hg(II)-responsive transcriptional regulator
MPRDTMKIGEVASRAGVNIDTIRYYERRGLLDEPERRPSGYREYPPETPRIVRFIKRAQDLGFTLTEIQDLLRLRDGRTARRSVARQLAEAKLKDIDEKLAHLQAMRSALYRLLEECACENGHPSCPIIESLDGAAGGPAEPQHSTAKNRIKNNRRKRDGAN